MMGILEKVEGINLALKMHMMFDKEDWLLFQRHFHLEHAFPRLPLKEVSE